MVIQSTLFGIASVPPHSASMVYNEFNRKITETRDNLDESEYVGVTYFQHYKNDAVKIDLTIMKVYTQREGLRVSFNNPLMINISLTD